MKLNLLSPEKKLVSSLEVEWVTIPTSEGEVQILPGHAPILGLLETGPFAYAAAGTQAPVRGVISSGFFEVLSDTVSVMAETVELADAIDRERAAKAQKKAEAMLGGAAELDEHAFKKYQLKVQRALVRQQAASHDHH